MEISSPQATNYCETIQNHFEETKQLPSPYVDAS